MGSVSTENTTSGRRKLDSEINMIPMIDLLMVTISFLLITAVWSQMARLDATAQVPGLPTIDVPHEDVRRLHIRTDATPTFTLEWKEGSRIIATRTVPRLPVLTQVGAQQVVHYPELEQALVTELSSWGTHRDVADHTRDVAVVHTPSDMPYKQLIAMMDAVNAVTKGRDGPAFATSLATD